MKDMCLFVRMKASEGNRSKILEIWEKLIKNQMIENGKQKSYYIANATLDPDTIYIMEQYEDAQSLQEYASSDELKKFTEKIKPYLVEPPELNVTKPFWIK